MPNVLLDKSYNKGFSDGTRHGMNKARKAVALEFIQRMRGLQETKGIGPVTWAKIEAQFGIEQDVTKTERPKIVIVNDGDNEWRSTEKDQ